VRNCSSINPAYRQVKYNLAMAREVLKHAYAAERPQPPTSLGAVLGMYGTLWARVFGQVSARGRAQWGISPSGVYALDAYDIVKVRFTHTLSYLFVWSD
jgi:F-type H+-transporting ATPase subunit g